MRNRDFSMVRELPEAARTAEPAEKNTTVPGSHRWQFSIARLLGITTVYAILLAGLADMPIRLLVIAAAVMSLFVAMDMALRGRGAGSIPRWCRVLLLLAYYTTCFGVCSFVTGLVHLYLPDKSPYKSVWEAVVGLLGGSFFEEFSRDLGIAIGLGIYSVLLSLIGLILSVICCWHYRAALFLAGINLGILVYSYWPFP